ASRRVAMGGKPALTVAAATLGLSTVLDTPLINADMLELLQPKGFERSALVGMVESRSGIATVDAAGAVFGNGLSEGRFSTVLVRDADGIVRPFALSLFHPAPYDVLLIGLSSGA